MPNNALTPDILAVPWSLAMPWAAGAASCLAAAASCLCLLAAIASTSKLARIHRLAERTLAAQRGETETLRSHLSATERALSSAIAAAVAGTGAEVMSRALEGIDRATRTVGVTTERMRVEIAARLADIERRVDTQLAAAVERQMTASFAGCPTSSPPCSVRWATSPP